ncbi:MAG: type I-C CRISPR-associated protein Cas7/Csd2 [Eubacterium sp.]|jgi:CRISPR-associated protein Csd2|nr:type I-C CRISPR-associated protein Cas7/Csd2 [Eubacterium sp.]
MLSNKIDFAIIIGVKNANPNGDPLNGNRPRTNYDGHGEISDVCLKRKIRNRLLDNGEKIFVQSDDYKNDECRSIRERFDTNPAISALDKKASHDDVSKTACGEWLDVRAFGQVLAFKGKSDKEAGVSIAVRGPVSIQSAFSLEAVDVESLQITKSVNLETDEKNPNKKASDTIGMKHRVHQGVYVTFGSINRQLAEKTGFSDEDAEKIKQAILKMFNNDESSARPAGSMEIIKLIWWTHTGKTLSSAQVHRSLKVNNDGSYKSEDLNGVERAEIDGV